MPKKVTSPIPQIPRSPMPGETRVKRSYKSRKRKVKKPVAKPVAKRTSKRADPIFASTLRAAEERFVELTARQQELVYELTMVQAELPAVQATMNALRAQLNPQMGGYDMALAQPPVYPNYGQQPRTVGPHVPAPMQSVAQQSLARVLPLPPRKPGKGYTSADAMSVAKLVMGPLKGMGSIPANQINNPAPAQLASEDETLVDDIGGEELVPDMEIDHKVG